MRLFSSRHRLEKILNGFDFKIHFFCFQVSDVFDKEKAIAFQSLLYFHGRYPLQSSKPSSISSQEAIFCTVDSTSGGIWIDLFGLDLRTTAQQQQQQKKKQQQQQQLLSKASAMSRKHSPSKRKIRSAVTLLNLYSLFVLLLATKKALAWIQSAKTAMRSSNDALFRHGQNRNGFGQRKRRAPLATMAPNRQTSAGLFLSLTQPTVESPSESRHVQLLDATLVGEYLVQLYSSSTDGYSWELHSIQDVIASEYNTQDGTIWTDGTEATEALSFGMSTRFSGPTAKAKILCRPNNDGDAFESTVNTTTENKELLSLLQILQAQWVASLEGTTQEVNVQTDNTAWQISRDSLSSTEGLSSLFREAGFLDRDVSSVEWVEMMTGSSRIIGKLPRSLVHKFNILHRGIGAFVTKDRPIDLSSSSSMPALYVHRRAADKRIFPSLYDMFVGGVSLAGEDAELTAQREIAEELGLSKALSTSLLELTGGSPFLKCLVCTAYNRCLVDLFQYTVDSKTENISWQQEEVAWGDFVDYDVVQASADLSMQRFASEGTWPGPYPPIQSELQGMLPNEEVSDAKWKEWDYVPDGLLVWKAWLEMLEQERKNQQEDTNGPVLSFEIEFRGEGGEPEAVVVELASMEDIVPQSQMLASRFNSNINDMQNMLKQMWADATTVPVYDGPSISIESDPNTAERSIELPSGLILELRPSTIGENAGLGLFVRKASTDFANVLQTQGSAFCGYGPCANITDSLEGITKYQRQRSFEFVLSDGLKSYVWHKGDLLTIGDVMKATGATSVRSHLLVENPDEDESSPGISLVHDSNGKQCYLVPPEVPQDPSSLTIQSIGHMCNDLAGGFNGKTAEEYGTSSDQNNILVLVPKVAVNDDGVIEPTGMPILTLAQSVYIGNVDESMEVGLRYGASYWKNESS